MGNSPRVARSARGRFAPSANSSNKRHTLTTTVPTRLAIYETSSSANNTLHINWEDTPTSAGLPPSKLAVLPHGQVKSATHGATTTLRAEELPGTGPVRGSPTTGGEQEKRILRSKNGSSRAISDLARFFPDFEDVVFGPKKEPDFLTPESVLFITETKPKISTQQNTHASPAQKSRSPTLVKKEVFNTEHATKLHAPTSNEWTRIDFTPFREEADGFDEDPLSDFAFHAAHKRGERQERQLRNIEKEHALHEKSDLERLMAELRGPDWLKTMGISGITDTEKKKFEPHRDHYLKRVKALLEKFTTWKEQEKELKLKRDEALAAREEAEAEEEAEEADDEESEPDKSLSFSEVIDPSARQLQLEAHSAIRARTKFKPRPPKPQQLLVPIPVEPPKPFVSFYSKPYMRAAALGNHRRGRSTTAFGLPLPEPNEQDFHLPYDFVTDEVVTANARKRRRLKRESNVTGTE